MTNQYYNKPQDGVQFCTKSTTFNQTSDLVNYWPFCGNANDVIGSANLYGGTNVEFVPDRFNKPQAAVYLNSGYYLAPPGVYFSSSNLTIMAWVKIIDFKSNARLFDFGNGPGIDNIVISFCDSSLEHPYFDIFNTNLASAVFINNLPSNEWFHMAVSFQGSNEVFYLNGTMISSSQINVFPRNVTRYFNYVGRSNWFATGDQDANAIISDLKFFNRGYGPSEILFEMTNSFY